MALFKKLTKEEKIQAKERERIHKEVIKAENEYRKEDKIPHEGAFVTLEHINKIYDNHVQAVYDFNLDIKPREFIVFVGPSGCGKSTTLRMIAGLENITYGNLFINGIYSNDLEPKDRDIAMVFQSYALYPHMSVFDNMAFGLKIRKHKTLHVDNNKIGLYENKTNRIIGIDKCLICDNKINDIYNDLLKINLNNVYKIIIRSSKNIDETMVVVDANNNIVI